MQADYLSQGRHLVIPFFIFLMSALFACGSIHQGLNPNGFGDEFRGRLEIYMCLATLFADLQINGGAKILVTSSFMEIFRIFLCAFSRSDVPGKTYSV